MNNQPKQPAVKTDFINIQAKEYHDKPNGNSYFSAVIDYKIGDKKGVLKIPFRYGYEKQFIHSSMKLLKEAGIITSEDRRELEQNNIELITEIEKNQSEKTVRSYGK